MSVLDLRLCPWKPIRCAIDGVIPMVTTAENWNVLGRQKQPRPLLLYRFAKQGEIIITDYLVNTIAV